MCCTFLNINCDCDRSSIDQSVVISASPTLDGTNFTGLVANTLEFSRLGASTYYTAQDWLNIIQSAGITSGFELSNSRNALELDIAAGTGIIKTTDNEIGSTLPFNYAGIQNLSLTADSMNYIYVDYNAGTPIVSATTNRSTIELNRQFILGRCYKNGTTLHIVNAGVHLPNLTRTEHERLVEIDGFTWASGANPSETGTLNIAITAGSWYMGHVPVPTTAFDSSVADTFIYQHYGTSSWIDDDITATAINCTQYNDGDDILGNLTVNAYGVQWIYITADNHVRILYDTINGTLASARAPEP